MKTKQKTIRFEMTIEEAKQLVINIGGQDMLDGQRFFNERRKKYRYREVKEYKDELLYRIFDRLDNKLINIYKGTK